MLGFVDYGLLILFFAGIAIMLLIVTRSQDSAAKPQVITSEPNQKESYTLLACICILLIAIMFLAQKERASRIK